MLYLVGIIIGGGFIIWALYYKLSYFECEGVCINSHPKTNLGYGVWYRYETSDSEEPFVRTGISFLKPKNGKCYRILVCENDHNKVIAYNYYLGLLVFGIFNLLVEAIFFIVMLVYM